VTADSATTHDGLETGHQSLRSFPKDASVNAPTAAETRTSTMDVMVESVIPRLRPRSVRDADVAGKHVLVRADLNVPLEEGRVADDTRIRAALPTLDLLRSRGAASLTVCSHLGRPKGPSPEFSIAPVQARLQELFDGSITVLENTRFDPRETANDPAFAQELAQGQDLFVEDAFGSVHRAHASTVAIAEILPAYAGLLLEQELEHLGRLLGEVARPFVLVCGGAKAGDKLPVISHLGARADEVLIGGKLAEQLRVSNPFGFPVRLPEDVVGVPRLQPDAESRVCSANDLPYGWAVLDIGSKTAGEFAEVIADAATIFWNGPMGLFEWPRFAKGTNTVARAVAAANAFSVVGGADTLRALNGLGLGERVSWRSTGGGAALEFLAGKELPGVAVIPSE
jgi:phosphoglycerate kinase